MSTTPTWRETVQGHATSLNASWESFLSQQHHHSVTKEIGKQLTADEIQAYPEYPHVHWELPAEKKGRIEVASKRGGPFKIAYEVHGRGPRKIIVSVMLTTRNMQR